MSKLAGHYEITRRAVVEVKRELGPDNVVGKDLVVPKGDAFLGLSEKQLAVAAVPLEGRERVELGLAMTAPAQLVLAWFTKKIWFAPFWSHNVKSLCDEVRSLQAGSVCLDVQDAANLNHWCNEPGAQAHHFMRASGATDADAHVAALAWIFENATAAAVGLFARFTLYDRVRPHVPSTFTGGPIAKHLGRALHAVQDSFSSAHAKRIPGSETAAGAILKLCVYKEEKGHDEHERADLAWESRLISDEFSLDGRQAVNASKELIYLVLSAGMTGAGMIAPEAWKKYTNHWLKLGSHG